MLRRMPPLGALRAYEAAARHLSFTLAAEELNVTPSAISHQVKALERWLGVPLFRRFNRALALTEDGRAYLPAVGAALDGISDATMRLLHGEVSRALTVSTLTSFAAGWLVPRLKGFRAAWPDIDVRLMLSEELVDFRRDGVDLAIRYGGGAWPGVRAVRFLTEDIFPVCSPGLLAREPLYTPADLARHTLLHDDMPADWGTWLGAAGVAGVDVARGPRFDQSNLVIQSAIDGEGVALGRSALVADALADGRLVRPFAISLPAQYAHYIVCPEAVIDRPAIRAFSDWLLQEAAVFEAA